MTKLITVHFKSVERRHVELANFYKSTSINWHFAVKENHVLIVLNGQKEAVISQYVDFENWAEHYYNECIEATEEEFNEALKSAMTKLNLV
jgi:hypothetical protein